MEPYYSLNPQWTDPARIRRERAKARDLRQSHWWKSLLQKGICHYCGQRFSASGLTMDHVVPLARGGESKKGNLVPACQACNQDKKLGTPAERLLDELQRQREGQGNPSGEAASRAAERGTEDSSTDAPSALDGESSPDSDDI